jgi:hypothetical protein
MSFHGSRDEPLWHQCELIWLQGNPLGLKGEPPWLQSELPELQGELPWLRGDPWSLRCAFISNNRITAFRKFLPYGTLSTNDGNYIFFIKNFILRGLIRRALLLFAHGTPQLKY